MINSIGAKRSQSPVRGTVLKIPPVPNMRTKGQCKLSEKELVKKITQLARRDAAAGKDSQHDGKTFHGVKQGTEEWRKLREDFVSLSSPDRMGLVKNTLSNLAGTVKSMRSKGNGRFDLMNIIFNNHKKFGADVGGNFVRFRDEQGNVIAEYSEPNGWNLRSTPAESARLTLFYDLWKQALADAQEELELEAKGEILA